MRFEVSDLLFAGFAKGNLAKLSAAYGIEFFYEFGKDYYWDNELASWGERALSIHAPCVAVNLAAARQTNYSRIYEKTFAYAQKINASFVVVHTNEGWAGEKSLVQARVIRRLRKVLSLSRQYGVRLLIENVGLSTKGTLLFDLPEFVALFDIFPEAGALLDTGHAHVNGWDIPSVVTSLAGRLFACHIHDNSGLGDEHLPVGKGSIDWEAYFGAVKSCAPDAVQVFEYALGFSSTEELERHITEIKLRYEL